MFDRSPRREQPTRAAAGARDGSAS